MRLKTTESDGLVFWTAEEEMTPSADYMAIGVKDGHVTLGWNLGSGEVVITYNESKINDGRWHKIRAQRLVKYRWYTFFSDHSHWALPHHPMPFVFFFLFVMHGRYASFYINKNIRVNSFNNSHRTTS